MFSGMALNISLLSLQLRSLRFDEPSCLQLCTVLAKVSTLTSLNLHDCSMGSNGAFLIACKVRLLADRLKFLDLTGISMGPVSAIQIGNILTANIHTYIRTRSPYVQHRQVKRLQTPTVRCRHCALLATISWTKGDFMYAKG